MKNRFPQFSHKFNTRSVSVFIGTSITAFLLPMLAFAQTGGGIVDFIAQLREILNVVAPFIVGLAVFVIVYGILGYISSAADEEKRKQAKDFIVWGIIGVFLMVSIWGLVSILVNTFNLDTTVNRNVYGEPQPLDAGSPTTIIQLIKRVNDAGSNIIPFLISIGVFIVILGVFNYIRQGDNEEKRAEARMFILWGVISIFVMLSIWGFVNILVNSFGLGAQVPNIPDLPSVPAN